MRAYKSPEGVIYNLDNFISFQVTTSRRSGPVGELTSSKLVATTLTIESVVMLSSKNPEECEEALQVIYETLMKPLVVNLTENTILRLAPNPKENIR